MINEETRRKLREINLSEVIKGLEVLPGEIQWEDTAADQVSEAPLSAGKPAGSDLCQPRIKQGSH